MGLIKSYGLPYYFFREWNGTYMAEFYEVQTPANLKYFNANEVNCKGHVEVLQNWLATSKSKKCTIDVKNSSLNGRKIFVYAGNMGDAQDLSVFIDLAESLKTQKSFGFLFVGRGNRNASLRKAAKAKSLDNVLFYDQIEPQEIQALYQQ